MKLLSDEEIFQNLKSEGDRRDEADVIAMYSSVLGGITKNRKLMTVPVEDHLVHRGDGVFEAFLLEPNGIYDFDLSLIHI